MTMFTSDRFYVGTPSRYYYQAAVSPSSIVRGQTVLVIYVYRTSDDRRVETLDYFPQRNYLVSVTSGITETSAPKYVHKDIREHLPYIFRELATIARAVLMVDPAHYRPQNV